MIKMIWAVSRDERKAQGRVFLTDLSLFSGEGSNEGEKKSFI